MFFPKKPRAFSEALRVLGPGGGFIFSVWDRIEENEFVTTALASIFTAGPPRFMARTLHGYFERVAIEADLARGWVHEAGADRDRRETQPGRIPASAGDRLLPGDAIAE